MFILELISSPVKFIYFIVALIIGITIHEFCHAWTAYKLGDPAPKKMGRVSLNPLAHLDPLGTVFLFLAGFGWGKPVIFNPKNFAHEKKGIILTSYSGAIANIMVAFIFSIPYRLNIYFNFGLENTWFYILFDYIVNLNLILAAFNILPIPPLDGSKILYLFVNEKTMAKLEQIGMPLLFLVLFLSIFLNFNFFILILTYIVNWLLYLVRVFPASPI